MPNTPPETLTLDRVATPVGGVLLVTDAEGAVRALDFADYEPRMMRLLGRHSPGFALIAGRAPETVRRAVEAYFSGEVKALPGVLARVRRVFDLSADPEAIARDLAADPALGPLVAARPGLRLPGDWLDEGQEPPNDRLPEDLNALAARAESWRPWRAYGALHLAMAGITGADLMETTDAKHAA